MLNNFCKAAAEIWKLQQKNLYAVGLEYKKGFHTGSPLEFTLAKAGARMTEKGEVRKFYFPFFISISFNCPFKYDSIHTRLRATSAA